MPESYVMSAPRSSTLADVLDRILDKGVVIAGDITILVADVELLTIKIRLLIASVDKAMEIGVNWWQTDPYLNAQMAKLADSNRALKQTVDNPQEDLFQKARQPDPVQEQ